MSTQNSVIKVKKALEIAKKLKNKSYILSVSLFGSVARGEATKSSDIDLAIIYDQKKAEYMQEVQEIAGVYEDIQITHVDERDLSKDEVLAGSLAGEGIILAGRPIIFYSEKMLKPGALVYFNLKNKTQTEKMRIKRALYGTKVFKGLCSKKGIKRLGPGVIFCYRKLLPEIERLLKDNGVHFKQKMIWGYE